MNRPNISDGPNVQYHILDSHGNTSQAKNRTKYKTISTPTNSRGNNKHCEPQALVARTYHPPFSNFLFTNLFSIKFLYFFIISSLFPYFNLFVSIFIQSYVLSNLLDSWGKTWLEPHVLHEFREMYMSR